MIDEGRWKGRQRGMIDEGNGKVAKGYDRRRQWEGRQRNEAGKY